MTGNAAGPLLFMTGKLKIKGDLALAARAPGFFEIRLAEIRPSQVSVLQSRVPQICPLKRSLTEISRRQVNVFHLRPVKISTSHVGRAKVRSE